MESNIESIKKPFFILSCDGGGVRGLATVSFLYHMELHMKTIIPDFSIYNQFDMFAGTSVGAFIIMLLVHLRKPITEIKESILTPNACNIMMDKSIWDDIFKLVQHNPKYDGIGKTGIIQQYIKDVKFNDTHDKYTIVPAYDIQNRKTKVFYSDTCHHCCLRRYNI